ncbi:hypothetical protein FPZ24_02565 [Sphingomonas panacisoli]|uniref:DUF3575 domain-containing protein n=1 Tax=Sphingomonas panacisoli TaxID=1813879 RepID=A0A5B8LFJ9_9SPHN|nr:hypothetical protein [Sphingomonas panacisoli]QDZ06494.1 hypothetical protein FPZ24_02565 [Sphingomonas panacisoli]
MPRGIFATIAMTALMCALWPTASSARQSIKRPVAAARFGLITSRVPRMGPAIVRRGGYTALADMVRPRFFKGMTDIYPVASFGLHISIGSRYFARPNFWNDVEQASRGMIVNPQWRGGGGVSTGFRRRTWALTTGYDAEVLPRLVIGLEGGALKGRAINPGPRGQIYRLRDREANRVGLNPIATLAVRYAF